MNFRQENCASHQPVFLLALNVRAHCFQYYLKAVLYYAIIANVFIMLLLCPQATSDAFDANTTVQLTVFISIINFQML